MPIMDSESPRGRAQNLDKPDTPWEKLARFQQTAPGLFYGEVCHAIDDDCASLLSSAVNGADSIPRIRFHFFDEIK